jgi:hypothetical protein
MANLSTIVLVSSIAIILISSPMVFGFFSSSTLDAPNFNRHMAFGTVAEDETGEGGGNPVIVEPNRKSDNPVAQDDQSLAQDDQSLAQDDQSLAQDDQSLAQDDQSLAQDDQSLAQDDQSLAQDDQSLAQDDQSLAQDDQSLAPAGQNQTGTQPQDDQSLAQDDQSLAPAGQNQTGTQPPAGQNQTGTQPPAGQISNCETLFGDIIDSCNNVEYTTIYQEGDSNTITQSGEITINDLTGSITTTPSCNPIERVVTIGPSTMGDDGMRVIATLAPCHLLDGTVLLNLPTNEIEVVVANLKVGEPANGLVANKQMVSDLRNGQALYLVDLDETMSGVSPVANNPKTLNDNINSILLWNNAGEEVDLNADNSLAVNILSHR